MVQKRRSIVAFSLALVATACANDSSCGGDSPSPVVDCDKVDHGSCGGACCVVDVDIPSKGAVNFTTHVYNTVKGYLEKGGKDGSYAYVTGPDAAGHSTYMRDQTNCCNCYCGGCCREGCTGHRCMHRMFSAALPQQQLLLMPLLPLW
jgi:hypothetical protein